MPYPCAIVTRLRVKLPPGARKYGILAPGTMERITSLVWLRSQLM
jgi:hypothetical protein